MAISITPALPVIAASDATPDPVLQPGTTVDAQVVQILSADLVRIAIASLSIDVLSEVPLQAGQSLQLAVSQTSDGIRLAVVGQSVGQGQGQTPQGAQGASAAGVPADSVPLAPDAPVSTIANSPEVSAPAAKLLTPLERASINVVTQSAATRQASLAPLFANLGAAAASSSLPPRLQQAVTQVLAQQTSLDQNLSGSAIKAAFEKSGIFLEASLASGSVASGSVASGSVAAPSGIPDLKAALIVLRQTLVSALGASAPVASAADAPPVPSSPQAVAAPVTVAAENGAGSPANAGATLDAFPETATTPSLAPEFGTQEILLPQARVPVAADLGASGETVRIVPGATLLDDAEPHLATAGTVLNLLQEALQELPREIANTRFATANAAPRGDEVVVRTSTPPPPFRGALPSAQPVSLPSLAAGAPLATTAHHLLGDTDAAIARQTLLQVASLPDRVDTGTARLDPAAPRWSFEIPFATPQGTALAQFEISRDGGGREVEAARRVWRARFTIDVEPAGPVHALVALSGEQTSVRMWAERPATAAQLRAGAAQLGQALSQAELKPGDIVIRDGAPPQPTPAPAGHFLDRAL